MFRSSSALTKFASIVILGLIILSLNLQATAQEKVQLSVDTSKLGPKIDRNIFGQFAEHLGYGVYEGVWVGPDSKIPTHAVFAMTLSQHLNRSKFQTSVGQAVASLMNITGAKVSALEK
jgi:alpha-N-arabinofuranosidase